MDAPTAAAFQAAAGSAAGDVLLALAGIVIVAAVLWLAWTTLSLFGAWQARHLDFGEMGTYLVRGGIALSVLAYFIR
jgi:integrating conjugative element protein (TIGR03758 family)